ncbi:MAG TPA: alkaline phosphatase D family protein [Thermoleophilaceae bacterium]|nr:alkaline phosphatase D family protein [Thermoleophilaceae bacterium]
MPDLLLGPMLRYASATEVTLWMEVDGPCEVTVLGRSTRTFQARGRHYALLALTGLEPGSSQEYEVHLDGERRWPPEDGDLPPSRISTVPETGPVELVFGSCRVSRPHVPPYTLNPEHDKRGVGVDALRALALRLRDVDPADWPDMLLLLGDQVYADEVPPETLAFIRGRRDVEEPPGEEVADFEEYVELYREAWSDPTLRWLLSTLPTAMIFDDHDVHDDWNTSEAWIEEMRAESWWQDRITGALATYWIYQHIGNLSPAQLDDDELFGRVKAADDAGDVLHEWATEAEREGGGGIWSFSRDLAGSRLVVLDGREGRVLSNGQRKMFDEEEWRWVEREVTGEFDHLLIANTLPVLLAPTFHHLEAWSDAVCSGTWGGFMARQGEKLRQGLDLEHWPAFRASFKRLVGLVREVGSGARGRAPASIVFLGGDVHQAYLYEVGFRPGDGVKSAVYQAVCSPFRHPMERRERAMMTIGRRSTALRRLAHAMARAAGVSDPEIGWRASEEPTFDNQIATLKLDGRRASLSIEFTPPGDGRDAQLETSFARELA